MFSLKRAGASGRSQMRCRARVRSTPPHRFFEATGRWPAKAYLPTAAVSVSADLALGSPSPLWWHRRNFPRCPISRGLPVQRVRAWERPLKQPKEPLDPGGSAASTTAGAGRPNVSLVDHPSHAHRLRHPRPKSTKPIASTTINPAGSGPQVPEQRLPRGANARLPSNNLPARQVHKSLTSNSVV